MGQLLRVPVSSHSHPALTNRTHTLHTPDKGKTSSYNCLHMYVTFFTFPTVNKKDLFWSLTVMCKWSKCDVFFTLLLQTPSWAGQESGFWWITRALWCCIFFPPHLSLKEQITVLHLVQVITNSIKVTNKTIFTHDCLISGHYILHLRFEWSELCFFSLSFLVFFFFFAPVILDEVLMFALKLHQVYTRTRQLRLVRV